MIFNEGGMAILKEFEGCKLEAYQDLGGIWTIGYGCTHNVHEGMNISQDEAEHRLQCDLEVLGERLKAMLEHPLNPNQFSALMCFAYNVKSWWKTPLFQYVQQGDFNSAASHWTLYDKAAGKDVEGLHRRRVAEKALFLS